MRNLRQYKRFKLDLLDLISKMSLVGKVQLIDISQGGVALKADRKLNMGKECLIMLGYDGKLIKVKGVVVRSELSGIEERADGEHVTVYSAGIAFKDECAGTVKDFLDSIEQTRISPVPEQADWFYRDIRFSITTPNERVLNMPAEFGLKEISQNGVIIQTAHQLKIDSMVLLELSLHSCDPVRFMGVVVSCRMPQGQVCANYDIGVEFSELTDQDSSMLVRFIDCMRAFEDTGEGRGK
jgi:Tfp pilus assembly protein PilZ